MRTVRAGYVFALSVGWADAWKLPSATAITVAGATQWNRVMDLAGTLRGLNFMRASR